VFFAENAREASSDEDVFQNTLGSAPYIYNIIFFFKLVNCNGSTGFAN
jgi:hypothetical protein